MEITIEKTFITDAISSGSGLGIVNDSVLIVGDDAEYIAAFRANDTILRQVALYSNAPRTRIDRRIKHDLESCVLWTINDDKYLIAFGSGGVSPYRDTLFAINVNDSSKNFSRSLLPLHTAIKNRYGLKDNELNIEGAALTGKKLLLFNRGKNFIVALDTIEFAESVFRNNTAESVPFEILDVALPVINGYPVGFSGACTFNEKEVLFTASLEETTDFTKDGAVKGSYVGLLNMENDSTATLKALNILKDKDGNVLGDKLESIDIVEANDKHIRAVAVADNDDGTSKIFVLNIIVP